MPIDNSIVLKIKKLLELANSSNKNEAEIASAKAQELLVKYNLDMQNVDSINIDYNEHDLTEYKRVPAEVREISGVNIKRKIKKPIKKLLCEVLRSVLGVS